MGVSVRDLGPAYESILQEVLVGLQRSEKSLPPRLLYDTRGSELFEQICKLDEYYLTRTELAIMESHSGEIAGLLGRDVLLIEYGSGSGQKTELLLEQLVEPAGYVPIDISRDALAASALRLSAQHPGLEILPVCADYTSPIELPVPSRLPARRAVYFPGSTLGNFDHEDARAFLRQVRTIAGAAGRLVIGIDLVKDPRRLERAYDDEEGISAAFALNVLSRLNRELGANFQCDRFEYYSLYNAEAARIEMYLVSQETQAVQIAGHTIAFEQGERICTEYSHKYTLEGFAELARETGWTVQATFRDVEDLFSVQVLASARP